jgi:hypothetical protein
MEAVRIYVAGPYTAKRETCWGCPQNETHWEWPGERCFHSECLPDSHSCRPSGGCAEPDVEKRDANVKAADEAGREIARRGHTPFIPHKMTYDWERDEVLQYEDFIRIDDEWLRFCDAILMIGSSPGADRELDLAGRMGLESSSKSARCRTSRR